MATIESAIRRRLETASELYDAFDFGDLNVNFFYEQAPGPIVGLIVGAVFLVFSTFLFFARYKNLLKALKEEYYSKDAGMKGNVFLRVFLAALMDGGDPMYTNFSQTGIAFLFLAFFQTNYVWALIVLVIFYTLTAFVDMFRVYLAYREYSSLHDMVVTTNLYRSLDPAAQAAKNRGVLICKPDNVYQNIARNGLMVFIVFTAQIFLTTLVTLENYSDRDECFILNYQSEFRMEDYSPTGGCPVTGYMISWLLYMLGILTQTVYLLGPGNNFGVSQHNPYYWLTLLLASKKGKATTTWVQSHGMGMAGGSTESAMWDRHDWRVWARFLCSTLVNGACFRILLHSLPIQLACKRDILTVIRQSLGVIWIAGLDDQPASIQLTLEENYKRPDGKNQPYDDHVPAIHLSELKIGMLLSNAIDDNANLSVNLRNSMQMGMSADEAIKKVQAEQDQAIYHHSDDEYEIDSDGDESDDSGRPREGLIYRSRYARDNFSSSSSNESRWV